MVKIFRYNKALKDALGTSVQPEPWLHAALMDEEFEGQKVFHAVVYVWDSRKIVDHVDGMQGISTVSEFLRYQVAETPKMAKQLLEPAKDNHKKLGDRFYDRLCNFK
jgi:hypothetical protein